MQNSAEGRCTIPAPSRPPPPGDSIDWCIILHHFYLGGGGGAHIGSAWRGGFNPSVSVDPVCVSIRPSFLFIDVSVFCLSETRYHTIVKICHQSGE